MENYRKIIKFGNSSFVVSLPNEWVKKNKLKKGDVLNVNETFNNELTFTIGSKEDSSIKKEKTIDITNKDLAVIKREFISAYIENNYIIRLKGKDFSSKVKDVKDIANNLIASEIIEENKDGLVVKDFVDLKEITFNDLIKKMDTITRSMMDEMHAMLDKDVSSEIILKDKSVNKSVFLLIRLLRCALLNPSSVNKKNLLSFEYVINIWDIASSIEKIADDLKRIARGLSRIKENNQLKIVSEILKIFKDVEQFYWESMKSYYNNNVELALNLSSKKRELADRCNEMHELYWKIRYVPIVLESLKNVISSIHNVGRRVYS